MNAAENPDAAASASAPHATPAPGSTPVVAVLGTGIMGSGMARSLLRAGLEVRAWNRTTARAEPLAAAGARVEAEAVDAVRGADVVITMLSDGRAVTAAMQAAAPGLTEGQIWLQTSTVGLDPLPELAKFAAGHGLRLVDAPVSGTRQPAENGQLLVLAAGPEQLRGPLTPVLDAIGAKTLWLGEDAAAGTATRLKLVVNGWVLATTTAAAEAVALSEALGIDPTLFPRTIAGGLLDSKFLQLKAAAIAERNFEPNFSAAMAAKDAELIVRAGEQGGVPLPMAAAIAERLARAVAEGHGEKDMAATYLAGRTEAQ
jgi:3-hydroxyisobutyrate dehydrogenase